MVVKIDNQGINSFKEKSFSSFNLDSHPYLLNWNVAEKNIIFDGIHTGYRRLKESVIHRRKIIYHPLKKLWKIKEFFYGTGKHKIEILMHTMPDIVIDII